MFLPRALPLRTHFFPCLFLENTTKVTPITTPLKSNRMEEIVQEWYANFVNVDQTLLFELVTAANFMDIKALLDLTCLAVSILIKVCYPKYGSYDFRQTSETLTYALPDPTLADLPRDWMDHSISLAKGKSAEEIRRIFNIKNNDFSEEEMKSTEDSNAMC